MEGKLLMGPYLIWVLMLLLGQLHGYKSCIVKERKALLELKKYMVSKSFDADQVLPTWTNDTNSDCCRWDGIECNLTSGRVIGLSVGEMYFDHSLLNLSLLHPFEEVRRLNLSRGIDGDSFSFQGFFDDVEGYKSLRKLKHLEILDLSSNAFRNDIFPFLNAATSLTTLNLRYNFMAFSIREQENITNSGFLFLHRGNGSIRELTHLKKLKALDLSINGFASPMVLQDLRNLPNLEVVGLAKNFLDGPIEEVCEMKNLRELDLSGNQFVGEIPLCLGSLKMLRVLDLSSNHFSGNLPYIFSSLESIEYLSLLENNFTGLLSLNPLTNLTKLKVFKLSSTSDKVQVEMDTNWHPKFQLSVAVLRLCSLEKIPSFLVYQKNLHLVDLSGNRLSGDTPTWLLANNTELKALQFQNNLFTSFQMPTAVHNLQVLDFSTNRIGGVFPDNIGHSFPNLVHMNGSCNGFQGQFPSSMGELKDIVFLDLSYNNFNGKLPRSFLTGCVSLRNLKLSYNKFSGDFFPRGTNFPSLNVLRMDNNLFTGKIGVGLLSSTELFALDMSNNCLTGAIPSWISKLSRLDSLKVSNNFLGGTIPPAFMNLSALTFLDISGNLLSGALPSDFNAANLFLQNNNFTGPIPDTWGYGDFQIIDLRNNKLYGSIPQFVADDTDADSLGILLLSGNNLTGSIPRKLCDLNFIRLLDLSDNKLSGSIPSCLFNLSSRLEGGDIGYNTGAESQADLQLEFYKSTFLVEKLVVPYIYFQEIEVEFAMKQNYYSYFEGVNTYATYSRKGILDYMFGMDLSNNELSGVIPAELGDLLELKAMNLSHNFLSSSIPLSFSNLKDIESLDLSFNMLHGSIPHQLTSLTSLEVFDVSHNNLSGIIPQGKQFNTFNESTYSGNPLLCGLPSNRSCVAKNSSEEANNGGEEEDDEAAIDMLIFYYSSASGYVTALIAIVVLMCFDCPWRLAWLRIVDAFIALAKIMLP